MPDMTIADDLHHSIEDRVVNCLRHKVGVPLLVGPPGVGKSMRMKSVAAKLDADFVDVRLSLFDAVDVKGLPFLEKIDKEGLAKQVLWAMPDFVARTRVGKPVVLCYEEINCASVSVMNTALQFILDRRVGEHVLGDNVYQVACCNKSEHRAHVNPMSAPLINRFMVFEVKASLDEFDAYAMRNNVHDAVIAYLHFRPDALLQEPKNVKGEFNNFATPRSWERTSNLVRANMIDHEYLVSSIGEGPAVEFLAFMKERSSMPDIDKLIAGEIEFNMKQAKVSVLYAISAAMANRAIAKPALLEGCGKVMHQMAPEIAALFVTLIVRSDLKNAVSLLSRTNSVATWMTKHTRLIASAMRV